MPAIPVLGSTPRKDLHVFYILDTSGSMDGEKISKLNHAMEECTVALTNIAKKNADAKLKIAVLTFNSKCEWVTKNGPEELEDFEWEYVEAGGLTVMGEALKELDSKLSRHKFLNSMMGALMPVMIFMTDGYATDDYMQALEEIRKNKWFRRGTKIAFAIGDDADTSMISSIVGNKEAVIQTSDLSLFERLMKFVTVTASMLVSESHTSETDTSGDAVVAKAKQEMSLSDDITPNLSDSDYSKELEDTEDDDWDSDEW